MTKSLLLLCGVLLLSACGGATNSAVAPGTGKGAPSSYAQNAVPNQSGAAPVSSIPSAPPKLERTASIIIEVKKGGLNAAIASVSSLADASLGFVYSSSVQYPTDGEAPSASITIKVPVDKFDGTLSQAQALGKVETMDSSTQDVTGQYVDLQARLKATQEERDSMLSVLAQAHTVSDILAVRAQLAPLQQEVEQLQGQLNLLDNQTNFSTIAITLHEPLPNQSTTPKPSDFFGLWGALTGAVNNFMDVIDFMIMAVGFLLPLVLLGLALLFLGRRFWHRRVKV